MNIIDDNNKGYNLTAVASQKTFRFKIFPFQFFIYLFCIYSFVLLFYFFKWQWLNLRQCLCKTTMCYD